MDTTNRNEIIGTAIGKILGHGSQVVLVYTAASLISTEGVVVVKTVKTTVKYGLKLATYAAKNYKRTDYSDRTIFEDFIDGSFFAD